MTPLLVSFSGSLQAAGYETHERIAVCSSTQESSFSAV